VATIVIAYNCLQSSRADQTRPDQRRWDESRTIWRARTRVQSEGAWRGEAAYWGHELSIVLANLRCTGMTVALNCQCHHDELFRDESTCARPPLQVRLFEAHSSPPEGKREGGSERPAAEMEGELAAQQISSAASSLAFVFPGSGLSDCPLFSFSRSLMSVVTTTCRNLHIALNPRVGSLFALLSSSSCAGRSELQPGPLAARIQTTPRPFMATNSRHLPSLSLCYALAP
jgi:hypothetical protein